MICQERTELNRIKNRFGIVIFHRCMILLTNKHSHNGLVTTDVSYYLFFIFLDLDEATVNPWLQIQNTQYSLKF